MYPNIICAASSLYEVLLIVFVLILIFNGLLRNKILKKVNNNLNTDVKDFPQKGKVISKKDESEYVDYEIIKD